MKSKRNPDRRTVAMAAVCALALGGLSACATSQPSNSCAFVDVRHLARPSDGSGKALICNPKRVNAAYRERYFPGYVWDDETW